MFTINFFALKSHSLYPIPYFCIFAPQYLEIMKKKNIYLIIAGVLFLLCLVIILFKTGVFSSTKGNLKSDLFAVKDTANVTRVFIADMNGEQVLLNRRDGTWYVNDSVRAQPVMIKDLLGVIRNVTLQQVVAQTAQSNINKMMSVNAIKVEIYQNAPKFTLFGKKFFEKERKVKTYYMGPATMNNLANFAILEGYDEPYIVYIPGFRGYITPFFSFNPTDWYNKDLFSTKITRIKSLKVQDFDHPEESFFVEKAGARFFNLFDSQHQPILDYDTVKLLDMLSGYRDLNSEIYVNDMNKEAQDSILRFNKFRTITLIDVDGNETRLDMYRKLTASAQYLDAIFEQDAPKNDLPYNRDNFYAILNGNTDNMVQCQYFGFDRQVQPLSYFLKQR